MTTTKLQDRFVELRNALNERHIERYDEVEISLVATLTGFHYVMVGPPGTAKSMLSEDIVSAFTGAKLFKYLFTKFTTPEEIFGPYNLALLKEGRYERITEGKTPTVHLAFFDEVFKANSAILNSCLTLMNERKFDNGLERIDAPLISVVAASNELPEGEELNALFDRFHFRKKVDYIHEPSNFVRMLAGADVVIPTFTLDELYEAQAEIEAVEIGEDVIETMVDIRSTMQMEGIIASDRRYSQSQQALRGMAWLHGRDHVNDDDFRIMEHMLWTQPQEIKKVSRIILGHTNPLDQEANEIIDMADEIAGQLQSALMDANAKGGDDADQALTKSGIEWFTRCRKLSERIKKLEDKAIRAGRPLNRIEQSKDRVLRVAREVGKNTIGLDSTELKFKGRS
jgi:MoxR-like ATPase